MRLLQLAGFFAGLSIAIYVLHSPNGYVNAIYGVAGAYFVTLPTIWLHWWDLRFLRKRWHREAARRGMLSGWRMHLPWNVNKPVYGWEQFLRDQRG